MKTRALLSLFVAVFTTVTAWAEAGVEVVLEGDAAWSSATREYNDPDGATCVEISLLTDQERTPPKMVAKWTVDARGVDLLWYADWFASHGVQGSRSTRATEWTPLYVMVSATGESLNTFACAETVEKVVFSSSVDEGECLHRCSFSFFQDGGLPRKSWKTVLRFDGRKATMPEAVKAALTWIDRQNGFEAMPPPPSAYDPLYSTWYAYHQDVSATKVEAACKQAADMGLKTVILDDGWQTPKNYSCSYDRCGDWIPDTVKFPDMRAHVDRVHSLGMRYMLWIAPSFVGTNSVAYARFKDKLLGHSFKGAVGVLDPRHPEVRRHIVELLEDRMLNWNLDGFKLDFFGRWNYVGLEPDSGVDSIGVPEAAEMLLDAIKRRLTAVRPDVLIEFRQEYVGSAMTRYGNMLRVSDCPCDPVANRIGIASLRLTAPHSAIHSDMLEWPKTESAVEATRYVLNALFGVVQYSPALPGLSAEHEAMMRHWIRFSQDHRKALLHGKFRPHYPAAGYPLLEGECDEERVFCVYQPNLAVDVGKPDRQVFIVNGAFTDSVILDLPFVPAKAEAFNTFGDKVPLQPLTTGLNRIHLPSSGYLRISWQ